MEQTKIFAFEKGICGCDEKRGYIMETAHAGRQWNKTKMLLPAENRAEDKRSVSQIRTNMTIVYEGEEDLKC